MTYRGDDGIEETRLFRLDRFRIDFLMGSERRAPRGWTKLSYKMLRAALQSSDRHDSVTVSDRLTGRTGGVITEDHRIVREFDIPRGKVSLLEALVIADTLHASTLEYSNLVHICQLWTVNFFNIVKAVVNGRVQRGVSVRDGPAAAQAGTAHNLKLVDTTTGRASLELLQATDKRLQNLVRSLSSKKLLEAESTELVGAIRNDIQLLESVVEGGGIESGPDPTSATAPDNFMSTKSIISLAQGSLNTLHNRIQSTIESRVREPQHCGNGRPRPERLPRLADLASAR
ncbi:hypothetical protein BKA62DRAFT_797672 [Auriculariales sp. MPI-PUGE-AT-0066]|nr:hypothetical protein BKA62DRAFT_797672 [Auriculariales sp. MPI-PUGE-AT-0066]